MKIIFGGIPNSRNVLFLEIFLKRAAKPSAGNPVLTWPCTNDFGKKNRKRGKRSSYIQRTGVFYCVFETWAPLPGNFFGWPLKPLLPLNWEVGVIFDKGHLPLLSCAALRKMVHRPPMDDFITNHLWIMYQSYLKSRNPQKICTVSICFHHLAIMLGYFGVTCQDHSLWIYTNPGPGTSITTLCPWRPTPNSWGDAQRRGKRNICVHPIVC